VRNRQHGQQYINITNDSRRVDPKMELLKLFFSTILEYKSKRDAIYVGVLMGNL